jgi:short-subunit dehydrogenase
MKLTLKPLDAQVIVITGASSGIGLVTAKHAAKRGASVVLAARNEKALHEATEAIRRTGGRAALAVADVADVTQVDSIADVALREFGRIDTWVNNAAVSMYGRITDLAIRAAPRGFVHGAMDVRLAGDRQAGQWPPR